MLISQLSNGVEGLFIKTSKFKTSRISINMFVKADEKDTSAYSLLQLMLVNATKNYPDYTSLNAALNELYGAALYGDVVKFGDMRIIKFVIAFLDDKFSLNGEKISKDAVGLLLSAIFDPPMYDGKFKEEDFQNNKRLLIEQISGEINDKRLYAIVNTEKAMYENELSGVPRYGTVETVQSLTNETVVAAHKKLLKEAFVRVNIISQSEPNEIFDAVAQKFSALNRNVQKINYSTHHKFGADVKQIEERLDVTQGKLCMGFTVETDGTREDTAKAAVFVDMFGGGPYSKLFTNVRENQSLCYYCAARYNNKKSSFIVDSGVLHENREKAYNGILEQLDEMKKGNFTDEDLNASKMALCDAVASVSDLSANLDNWYSALVFDEDETTETYIEKINRVSKEDVIKKANSVKLDTVYFLGGLKGEND